ncbi:MAG: serpin family protein [Bacteroidales bacterium]|nr:serpin family protein [Bacteroidales bacterium]
MSTFSISSLATIAIILLQIAGGCAKDEDPVYPDTPQPVELNPVQLKIVEADNSFAIGILKKVSASEQEPGNIMISPLSISYALTMTANGASGATRDSMLSVLQFSNLSMEDINSSYMELTDKLINLDKRVTVKLANSVWVENRLSPKTSFMTILEKYYSAEVREFSVTDPGIVAVINGWIADATNNTINHVLDEISQETVMMLINAIYFNGKWKYKFNAEETSSMPFYRSNGTTVQADMMKQNLTIPVAFFEDYSIAEIPYGQGNFVMDVILPAAGNHVTEITANMDNEFLNNALAAMNPAEIDLYMPRFTYEFRTELNDILDEMGMGIAFDPESADFSNISDDDLYIDKAIHQSFIKNNEEGTEASAVTVITIGVTSIGETRVIKLDRPFIYFIRESETNTILFAGITGNPAS